MIKAVMPTAPSANTGATNFQDKPAKNSTYKPDDKMSKAVPRSGCFITSKVGTITSPYKFFLDWKRITEDEEGVVSLDTMLRGTCSPANLLDIFENFLLFDDSGGEIVKIMAKNHQYIGVNKVLNQVNHIDELNGKLGVFWHTQGSGKSYSMVFICQKILRKLGGSYTFLIVVDRSELNVRYTTPLPL